MPNYTRPKVVLVTADNHQWASEITGYSVEEIQKFYKEAYAKGEVCTVLAKR